MKRWLLFLGLSGLLTFAVFYKPFLPSLCTMKTVTGLGCPGCGMTRSVVATAHGRIGEAVRWHLFGPAVFLAIVAVWGATLIGWRIRWDHPWIVRSLVGFVVILFAYWGVRILQGTVP